MCWVLQARGGGGDEGEREEEAGEEEGEVEGEERGPNVGLPSQSTKVGIIFTKKLKQ